MTGQLTSNLISKSLAQQIFERFQTKQAEIESFMRALVEVESPSGDEDGSCAVVDLIVDAARSVACVDGVERVDVPGFGQHLVIKAFSSEAKY